MRTMPVCLERKDKLDTHVWQIHQLKTVRYVFVGFFGVFWGCVLGGILKSIVGGILGGTLGGVFGAYFFASEEGLSQHQGKYISGWSNPGQMHPTGPEWKPKKKKKERKKKNKKRMK